MLQFPFVTKIITFNITKIHYYQSQTTIINSWLLCYRICQRGHSSLKSGGRESGSKNFDFYRQIYEKFRFFRQFKKLSIFQARIGHLQLPLGKLFYFSTKVTNFEHTSFT